MDYTRQGRQSGEAGVFRLVPPGGISDRDLQGGTPPQTRLNAYSFRARRTPNSPHNPNPLPSGGTLLEVLHTPLVKPLPFADSDDCDVIKIDGVKL